MIVVDNGSDDDIAPLVNQFGQASAAYEGSPGSYAARNKGIALANGEVIAFTDSDCVPNPDWLEKGVANLLKVPHCGLVAGHVMLFFKNPEQPTAVELYESLMAFPQQKYVEHTHFGATANLFTFKSVIEYVGGFNETLHSSGDYEWGMRVFSAGYQQIYAADTSVAHPARASLSQLRNKLVRVVQGRYDLRDQKISLLQKYKRFIKALFKELLSTCETIMPIFSSSQLKTNQEKIKVISITFLRSYWKISEKIKLDLNV